MADESQNQGVEGQNPGGDQKPAEPVADPRSWVPADLKGHKSLEKFKTAEDAVKGYINLESAFGKKFEEHLKSDAPEDVRARVRSAMGVPGQSSEYDNPAVPEGYTLPEDLVAGFKEAGFKAGLSKSQFKELADWYVNKEMERSTQVAQERGEAEEKGLAELNAKWGAASKRNIALVQQLVHEVGGKDLVSYLNESGATNDPRMVVFLHSVAEKFQEDKLMTPNPIGVTAEDAKAELMKIRAEAAKDKSHPYVNREHPGHKAMVEKMLELTQLSIGAA